MAPNAKKAKLKDVKIVVDKELAEKAAELAAEHGKSPRAAYEHGLRLTIKSLS